MKYIVLIKLLLAISFSYAQISSQLKVEDLAEFFKESIRDQDLERLMSKCLITSDLGEPLLIKLAVEKKLDLNELKRSTRDDYMLDIYKSFYEVVVDVNKNYCVFSTVKANKVNSSSSSFKKVKSLGYNLVYDQINITILANQEGKLEPEIRTFRLNQIVEVDGGWYFMGEVNYFNE